MNRLEANRAILAKLSNVVENFSQWRFHQILMNVGIEVPGEDKFYEESEETLKKLEGEHIHGNQG
jgi:hypothetical protein